MIERTIKTRIEAHLQLRKVVLLFGARRVGKTVLLKQVVQDFQGKTMSLNGEDYDVLTLMEPQSIANYRRMLQGVDFLAIDEAQHIPQIGQKLKLIVDEIEGLTVMASCSSSFDLIHKAGEPLVGRSFSFNLFPFSYQELSVSENVLDTRRNLEDRLITVLIPRLSCWTTTIRRKNICVK